MSNNRTDANADHSASYRPILALTMGDPAGVGPEIIAGAWADFFANSSDAPSASQTDENVSNPPAPCRPVVFGHPTLIREAVSLRQTNASVIEISDLSELDGDAFPKRFGPHSIPCLQTVPDALLDFQRGEVDKNAGEAAFLALNRAIDEAIAQKIDAIVTAPLNKESLNLAGHHFPGHTEILASRCGVDDFAMMLYLGPGENLVSPTGLAVVHVTLHTAMKNVFDQITQKSVGEKIHLIRNFMTIMKGGEPSIGVCALNCHNGENGLFGDEEITKIRPAVETAQKEGLLVRGPFPSDTLMIAAQRGEFDGIVAMIHDQGHIAVKLMGMHRAVNITLGLPIIRTSVAHGTAFDIAWQGKAKTTSLVEAVRVAVRLAEAKRKENVK